MPKDTAAKQPAGGSRTETTDRLKEIRDKVADLQQRLKTDRDPKALAELGAEIGRLTGLLDKVIAQVGKQVVGKSDANAVVWPKDLSATMKSDPAWGRDPSEVAGE